jgi:hypothetical protein
MSKEKPTEPKKFEHNLPKDKPIHAVGFLKLGPSKYQAYQLTIENDQLTDIKLIGKVKSKWESKEDTVIQFNKLFILNEEF